MDAHEQAVLLARQAHMRKYRWDPTGKKRKKITRKISVITKVAFRKALRGTAGIKTLIARRLRINSATVHYLLKRPGWDDMRVAYEQERCRMVDESEKTVYEMIKQRDDLKVCASTALKVLSTRGRDHGYGEKTHVTLEGGARPIQVEHSSAMVEVENLPLELRVKLLEALDATPTATPAPAKPKLKVRLAR